MCDYPGVRIPRVQIGVRLTPGRARWLTLLAGVLLLSVILAVGASIAGLLGGSAGDGGSTRVDAWVVRGEPCASAGAMEVIRYTLDGQERTGQLDGCGHQPEERVEVRVGASGEVGHAAQAAAGQGRYGQRLGELLLVLASVAGAGYGLLVRRGRRGNPLPVLGPWGVPRRGVGQATWAEGASQVLHS